MTVALVVTLVVVAGVVAAILFRARARHREQQAGLRRSQRAFIRAYVFPPELVDRLREQHPDLAPGNVTIALDGLKQFFLACLAAEDAGIARNVGMPSKIVDEAWHEFLLMTREYHAFCLQAFGHYLHHTPRAQMREAHEDALANTLHQLKRPETLIAGTALGAALPALFTLDRTLGVPYGYHYDHDAMQQLERRRAKLADVASGGDVGVTVDGGGGCSDGGGSACGDGGGSGCGGSGCGGGCGGS